MPDFVHLHNHSYYSILDGLSSIKEIVGCASDLGFKSLALTDHGTCAGLYHFQKACHEKNIKPILGMEGYICNDHTIKDKTAGKYNHIILLAKNKIGYKNLIYLSSFGYIQGFYYKPRIDFEILEKHKEGLIVSTACIAGEVQQLLLQNNDQKAEEVAGKYKETFKDDFYLEVMAHQYFTDKEQEARERAISAKLYRMGKKMGIKVICTQDMHYARKEDWEEHDILISIQTHDTIKNPERFTFGSDDFYMKPYEQMAQLYKKAPELLANTVEIAEKIEDNLIVSSTDLLPDISIPPEFVSDEAYLKELVTNGMKERGLINSKPHRERIKYEMSVIIRCKYTKYFLVLWDIINFARNSGIRIGIGRGSGVSSLCLYALGITGLDPLKYDLLFERFLNPERISPPDVDMDFDYNRREEVYNYVVNKYGSEYCCQIGTYVRYKARAAIKNTAKALDVGRDWDLYEERKKRNPDAKIEMTGNTLKMADAMAKQVPYKTTNIKDALNDKKGYEFKDSMHRYPLLLKHALRIEGTLASAGKHPAGIVVSKEKIIDHIPIRVTKGVVCSQYDMNDVDELGLLKFDLLAIKTLTVIDKTVKMIKSRHDRDIDIDKLEPNDPKVLKSFMESTTGLFQFESSEMHRMLCNISVDSFEDLIVACALYRPGPLGEGMHEMFAEYKHNPSKIKYLHPKMGEALKDTYGILVYQENLMKVCRVLAGFTGGQSDTFRKVVGKKKVEIIKKEKLDELFINGCVKNGISKDVAEQIFKHMLHFAGYGFNKSHSAAYAFIAYQTAWLKYYYPIEYMCNLLTSEIDNTDKDKKLDLYIKTADRMGVKLWKAHINRSGHEFIIDKVEGKEVLRAPLTALKGVGNKAVDSIVKNQPYKDFEDFMRRTEARVVNTRVFATIVEAGCMDEAWGVPRKLLLSQHGDFRKRIEKEKKDKAKQDKKNAMIKGTSLFNEFNGIVEEEESSSSEIVMNENIRD